jgi:DNA-binding beta-propeller fold protein YncE
MRPGWMLALFAVAMAAAQARQPDPLRLVQTIPLAGVEGRFDHFAVDLEAHHLFLAALGNNTLEVLDLKTGKRARHVGGLQEPQGVAFAPETGRLFVGCGGSSSCELFDSASLAHLASVKGMEDADNVRFDAGGKKIYVGYGGSASGALGILDAASGKRLGQIPLAAHPESFQLEKAGSRIFVNVPGAGHVAVVDRAKRTVVARWPLQGAAANFPMALDEANRRLFIGCRRPPRVLVYDTTAGKVVAQARIAGDTDDLFYDAATRLLYASCGEGFITVLRQRDADHYEPCARLATAPGARTCLFVTDLRRLYLAVPHRGDQAAEIRVYEVAG